MADTTKVEGQTLDEARATATRAVSLMPGNSGLWLMLADLSSRYRRLRTPTKRLRSFSGSSRAPAGSAPPRGRPGRPPKPNLSRGIDKTVLALPKPRRVRDREHVHYGCRQPP